jgi:hypothetical protein
MSIAGFAPLLRRVVFLSALALVSVLAVGILSGGTAEAGKLFEDICSQPGAGDSAACTSSSGNDNVAGPNGILVRVTNLIALITGIVAVGMIIYSGFTYVTSAGDSGKLEQARKTIIYALVGLVVIVVARGIILFVISRV